MTDKKNRKSKAANKLVKTRKRLEKEGRPKKAKAPPQHTDRILQPEDHDALRQALEILTDKDTDKAVVANFLNKCAVEVRSRKLKVVVKPAKKAAPSSFAAGVCFKSHTLNPNDYVTIWRDGEIDHSIKLTRRQAIEQNYEACSW